MANPSFGHVHEVGVLFVTQIASSRGGTLNTAAQWTRRCWELGTRLFRVRSPRSKRCMLSCGGHFGGMEQRLSHEHDF